MLQRTDEFAKRQCAGGIEEQWLWAIDKLTRVRRCPVSPFAWDCKWTPFGMAQAQRLYARDLPDLQHNKMMTSEGMKGVSDLDRSQRLTGPMCSSKQPCLRFATGWCKVHSSSSWSRSLRLTFNRDRLDTVLRGQLMKRSPGWPRQSFSTRHAP